MSRVLVGSSDDPVPRQSCQAQAAEDILDKYRNIKRTSPSDGATGGASYDGTGGEISLLNKTFSSIAVVKLSNLPILLYMLTDLCVEDGVHDSPREDTHISTDDLPDSASQTAQQHGSKFSFRSKIQNPVANHKLQLVNNHST